MIECFAPHGAGKSLINSRAINMPLLTELTSWLLTSSVLVRNILVNNLDRRALFAKLTD